jgi:hypothetical protein
MVIDRGDRLELAAVLEQHRTHHVQLPQLHRPPALPPAVLPPRAALAARVDHAQPDQRPADRRPARQRLDALAFQPIAQPVGTPARMQPAQLDQPHLDHRGHLMRTRPRPM